jgi:hypothetical protein
MRTVISVSYSDIFEGDIPNLKVLLEEIPSEVVITILSLINSQLYLGHDLKTQIKILDFLTFRQSEEIKNSLLSRLIKKSKKDPSIEFFGLLYSTEFIHHELLNYRDFQIKDTTPQQELNLIKAYFVIVEQVNTKYSSAFKIPETWDTNHFQKTVWPSFIDQFEINHSINPITGMVKGITFLNYLEFHSPYSKHVKIFLQKNQKEKSWNYMLDLINLIKSSWDAQEKNPRKLYPFSFNKSQEFNSLFENFTISIENYRKEYSSGKKNFSGLKDKPLFKIREEKYLVINWNFLSNKLYDGLLFDFFHQSGILSNGNFKSFLDFKKFVSEEVVEKYLFKKLIENCFKKKHITLVFDDKITQGFPDAYVREGKNVFLIEIKDAFFPVNSVNSLSYDTIKSTIDQKYNNNKKGTGQLIKQIEKLRDSKFEKKTFEHLKLKRRNLKIYPIMIYTDNFYSLPGVSLYLRNEFRDKIKANHLNKEFEKIEDLTFMPLSFLIDKINFLTDTNFTLKKCIEEYHLSIKTMEKKFEKKNSMENLFELNQSFETVISTKYLKEIRISKDYIKKIVNILNLMEGLPLSSIQATS